MKRIILIIGLFFALPATAEEPNFLVNWKNQAKYFFKLDFSNESRFKSNLSSYYKSIYAEPMLARMLAWIENGSIESEYFSWHFKDLDETVLTSIEKVSVTSYTARSTQKSCYSTDYNPLRIETLVKDYKIKNYTQKQVDKWYSALPFPPVDGEICLTVNTKIDLKLNAEADRIMEETWTIIDSQLKLKPNQSLNSTPKNSAN